MYLTGTFSLDMLQDLNASIFIKTITAQDVRDFNDIQPLHSVIGHPDTAGLFNVILGFDVPYNPTTLHLATGSQLIVGQYQGQRLPAGATELPQGSTIQWALVKIRKGDLP